MKQFEFEQLQNNNEGGGGAYKNQTQKHPLKKPTPTLKISNVKVC